MKAILYKRDDNFYSLKVDGIVMATSNGMLVDYNLSKQNCDDIFGVVDVNSEVEDIVKTICPDDRGKDVIYGTGMAVGIQCFNKSMELNKDKLFTLEDMRKAYYDGYEDGKSGATFFKQLIQSLQQPTEIEVVIEMERSKFIVDKSQRDNISNGFNYIPKLDNDGFLILRKK